ncbi:MAG: hypothetical protein ACFWUL_10675 [Dialister sp.]
MINCEKPEAMIAGKTGLICFTQSKIQMVMMFSQLQLLGMKVVGVLKRKHMIGWLMKV